MRFIFREGRGQPLLELQGLQPLQTLQEQESSEEFCLRLEQASNSGLHCGGWFSYEASPLFDDAISTLPDSSNFPRMAFFAAKNCQVWKNPHKTHSQQDSFSAEIHPEIERDYYLSALDKVLAYIANGDIYQANFSFRCKLQVDQAYELFCELMQRHPVPYAAYAECDDWRIISLSPELFLQIEDGRISTLPMKGTIKRKPDWRGDLEQQDFLQKDLKSRAENVMIVDLMRNDFSKICQTGSVKTPQLFQVDRYPSLHQMVSRVEGDLLGKTHLHDILCANFPPGSITGAPKIRSTQIIEELEQSPRRIYTGSLFLLQPQMQRLTMNVAIRTVLVQADGQAELGIGSGVVADSCPEDEWQECLLKSHFLTRKNMRPQQVFSTMLCQKGEIPHVELHLQRLENSCRYFNFSWPITQIKAMINQQITSKNDSRFRLRLSVDIDAKVELQSFDLKDSSQDLWGENPLKIKLSNTHTDSTSPFIHHKTNKREIYNSEFKQALIQGFGECIFLNESQSLTEGCISNILIYCDKRKLWLTPAAKNGLLPGILRQIALKNGAEESQISLNDLKSCPILLVGNSLRGWREVSQVCLADNETINFATQNLGAKQDHTVFSSCYK